MKRFIQSAGAVILFLLILMAADYIYYQHSSKSLMLRSFDCNLFREYDPLVKYPAANPATVTYPLYLKFLNPNSVRVLCSKGAVAH